MTWYLDGNTVAFDLETSGTDVEADRIVTAAVTLVSAGEAVESHTWLADPGVEIPAEAAAIHGFDTDHCRTYGRPAAQVVAEVVDVLASLVSTGVPLVAMNARFDFTILDREARRHGVTPLSDAIGDAPLLVIDPYVIDKQVDRYRRGSRKLTALCEHYGVELGDAAHEAAADALAGARVAIRLAERFPRQLRVPVEELTRLQVGWAANQATSLQQYLRKSKDPEAVCPVAWPLVPFGGAS